MIIAENSKKQVRLTNLEKSESLEELNYLYNMGGIKLRISPKENVIKVKDKNEEIIASLIGQTATILISIYRIDSSRVVSTFETEIKDVISIFAKNESVINITNKWSKNTKTFHK